MMWVFLIDFMIDFSLIDGARPSPIAFRPETIESRSM